MKWLFLLVPSLCLSICLSASASTEAIEKTRTTPEQVKKLLADNINKTLPERIAIFSAQFLGTPYVLGPFGEGPDGKYDKDPLWRFDAFDCTTYVETVMALALSKDFDAFEDTIRRIRYKDGVIGFTSRNHFPEVDWIPNNTLAGFIADITAEVARPHDALQANVIISKRGWYPKIGMSTLSVPGATADEKRKLLEELHMEGQNYPDEPASTPYLSFRTMLADPSTLDRIPSGTILNIVRPNWNLAATYGTNINISHQTFVIRKNGIAYMRNASSTAKKVVDVPLLEELKSYANSPTARGVNLLEIR